MHKLGELRVKKVWAQLTNSRDQLRHQIGLPCPPCPTPCRPPGLRDAGRMEIQKYHQPTYGRTGVEASKKIRKCFKIIYFHMTYFITTSSVTTLAIQWWLKI